MTRTRRSILASTGLLLATPAVHALPLARVSNATATFVLPPNRTRLKVVVTGGHPGDPEYACGGLIAKLTQQGHEVTLLYLNDGAWPPTSADVRLAEAAKACSTLKARPLYAGQQNGNSLVDKTHYDRFTAMLQSEAPDAVFTHWPIDNHRDHRAVAMLTYDAWLNLKRSFALYYFEVSDGEDTVQFSPDRYCDISGLETIKKAACYAHASQTPDRYYALQDSVALFRGKEIGVTRAEAYVFQRESPFDILGAHS